MHVEVDSSFLSALDKKCQSAIESGDPADAIRFQAMTGFKPLTFTLELIKDPQHLATRIESHQSLRHTDTTAFRAELDDVVAGRKWSDLVVQDGINKLQSLHQEMQDYPDIQNEARSFTTENVQASIYALTRLQQGHPTSHFVASDASILLAIADTSRNSRVDERDQLPFSDNLPGMAQMRALREVTDTLNTATIVDTTPAKPSKQRDDDGPSI